MVTKLFRREMPDIRARRGGQAKRFEAYYTVKIFLRSPTKSQPNIRHYSRNSFVTISENHVTTFRDREK